MRSELPGYITSKVIENKKKQGVGQRLSCLALISTVPRVRQGYYQEDE